MNVLIDSFLDYLRYERDYSEYTINAYFKDLQQFEDFVKEKKEGIFVPGEVDTDIVRNWIISLLDNKISPVSVNRKLSSLKSFFKPVTVCDRSENKEAVTYFCKREGYGRVVGWRRV